MFNARAISVCSFLIVFTGLCLAQVDTAWVRHYNGPPGNSIDQAVALAVDNSGNVYVTGRSNGSGFYPDYATIKYAPNGDTLWVRRYNGPGNFSDEASALAVDTNGNVYVTGRTHWGGGDWDYATIKYAPNGDILWVRRYDGPQGSGYDRAVALALDDSGNVYVTGYCETAFTFFDYATIKYAPNGDTLWVRRYNGPGNLDDGANGLAVDNDGNVYVTGYSNGGGSYYDYATIKYAPNGDTVWVRRYNGPGNSDDSASALAVDNNGNVYVTGESYGSGSYYDYATIKYKSNGDTAWVRRYNGPADSTDGGYALAVDTNGNVYVTGYSTGSGTPQDYATIKYKPNGDTAWVRRYNGPVNGTDVANALAVDDSGNVYVTGYSTGIGSYYDYATIKYDQASCVAKPGDANASGTHTLGDAIAIVNYIFTKPGCSPTPMCWLSNLLCRGDWDGSTTVTLSDVIRAVNFIFSKPGGPWNAVSIGVCCL
jgi:uncharacterized delta-60 repeat protein